MMEERKLVYFVADVHLGLETGDPREREERFLSFLKGIPAERTDRLYLLGDIWDFWYEYRDVVPREGVRVIAELIRLMDLGVEVWFCRGNHDIWSYSYFESLGMHRFEQPHFVELGGMVFCLGHGDLLGGAPRGYRWMIRLFSCRLMQRLFSSLHPRLAFSIARGMSRRGRQQHRPYHFRAENEPLYRFAEQTAQQRRVDCFLFGHFHDAVDLALPSGARFCILKDWLDGGVPYGLFTGSSFELHSPASPAE
jgi:UDP-2,3-diacylglucosamine hydrolase